MAAYLREDGTMELTPGIKEVRNQAGSGLYDLALQQAGTKPQYAGTFENQLNDLYDKIENREKFSYDVNADPLYQAYKDRYIQQGKLAMKDTMGQAAALTGGYGNTYGQQVGQQAYNAYLQNLSAVIPELYGMAYNQYQDEGDRLKDLYGMLGQRRDEEYGRYRDEVGDWGNRVSRIMSGLQWDQTRETEAEKEAYNRRMNEEAIERQEEEKTYNRGRLEEQWQNTLKQQARANRIEDEDREIQKTERERKNAKEDEETAYKKQQQAYSNLYALIKSSGYSPTDDELLAAGMTREAANALIAEYQRSITPVGGYGSTGGSGGGRSGGGNAYYQGLDDPWAENGSDYDIWKEAVEMAQADGADAWNINSEVQRAQNLTPEEKRSLIVSGIENVDWDSYDRNGRLQYVNNNDQDTVAMGQVAPNNTAYENVMNNLSTTDELIDKIRNKKKKPTFRTDRLE